MVLEITPLQNLQNTFDSVPENSTLILAPGEYHEKSVIRTSGLKLVGKTGNPEDVRIIWDDYALKLDEQGREYNTFRTWTMAVCADNVSMEGISIINNSLYPETKGQEVALSVVASGFEMKNCVLTSTQDTLFLGPLPEDLIDRYNGFLPDELRRGGEMAQRFTDCVIEGTTDFIFGCGDAYFKNCEIRSLVPTKGTNGFHGVGKTDAQIIASNSVSNSASAAPALAAVSEATSNTVSNPASAAAFSASAAAHSAAFSGAAGPGVDSGNLCRGFLCAPAHALSQERGIVFESCKLSCQEGLEPDSVWLARPWRDYGLVSFINCTYGPHIKRLGFDKWNDSDRDKTARFYEYPPVSGRTSWVRVPEYPLSV